MFESQVSPKPFDEEDPIPLWERNMPGVSTFEEVEAFDLDNVKLDIKGQSVVCSDLMIWRRVAWTGTTVFAV